MAKSAAAQTVHLLNQLRDQCVRDSKRWFPTAIPIDSPELEDQTKALMHHTLSLCGEAGEVANIVKKIDRGSLELATEVVQHDLREELTDAFIYLLNIAGILNIDLLAQYMAKRNKNIARFEKKVG